MASNRELSEQAEALGKELGISVDTKGLNNQALTELVAHLEKRADAAAQKPPEAPKAPPAAPATETSPKPARPPIDGASDGSKGGPPPKAPPKATKSKAPYVVAKGKALTCRRGVLGPGDEIKVSDVSDGQAGLERLVKSGHVVKQ